jgi:hypothetical protein
MGMIEPMLSEEPQQAVSKEAASAPDVPRQTPQVCLLGASFDTGNLGVSALAESSVRCILARWSDAQVILLASSRDEGWHRLKLADRTVAIRKVSPSDSAERCFCRTTMACSSSWCSCCGCFRSTA